MTFVSRFGTPEEMERIIYDLQRRVSRLEGPITYAEISVAAGTLTLENDIVEHAEGDGTILYPVKVRKYTTGLVTCLGRIDVSASASTARTDIFQLPVGWAPLREVNRQGYRNVDRTIQTAYVGAEPGSDTDGQAYEGKVFTYITAGDDEIALDSLSWYVG